MKRKGAERLYQGITNVREDFIEDAQNEMMHHKTVRHRRKMRWIPAAACLVLLFGIVTAFATSAWGAKLLRKFTSPTESGYDLAAEIERKKMSCFSDALQDLSGSIAAQFENLKASDSRYPGQVQQDFASLDAALRFIGLKELRFSDVGLTEDGAVLLVTGDSSGKIENLILEACYHTQDIRVQAYATIYTENGEGKPVEIGAAAAEKIAFAESYYTTAGGIECLILSAEAMESGYQNTDGYLVKDGILYSVHIAYLAKDRQRAEKLLHRWADGF